MTKDFKTLYLSIFKLVKHFITAFLHFKDTIKYIIYKHYITKYYKKTHFYIIVSIKYIK